MAELQKVIWSSFIASFPDILWDLLKMLLLSLISHWKNLKMLNKVWSIAVSCFQWACKNNTLNEKNSISQSCSSNPWQWGGRVLLVLLIWQYQILIKSWNTIFRSIYKAALVALYRKLEPRILRAQTECESLARHPFLVDISMPNQAICDESGTVFCRVWWSTKGMGIFIWC